MKKIVRTNIQLIAAIFIAFGLNSTARAMEEMEEQAVPVKTEESRAFESSKKSKKEEIITLTSSDGGIVIVSRDTAELSGTIKNLLLEDLEDMKKDDSGGLNPIPDTVTIPDTDKNSLKNIFTILKVVESIAPREIDKQKSPYKVQEVVDDLLKKQSFEQIRDILFAANFLDIPFLFDALARALVHADQAGVADIVNLLELKKEKKDINEALSKINENDKIDSDLNGKFIPQFTELFEHYLKLKAVGITKEYSIADLIEEKPEKIELTHGCGDTLDLSNLGLTSLDGIDHIDPEIKDKVKILNLSRNQLTNIPLNVFQGLNNLLHLNLSHNNLMDIEPNAFKGLNNLLHLNLSHNNLMDIEPNAFKGFDNLLKLDLSANQITNIQSNAFKGLKRLKEIWLINNQLASVSTNAFQELNNLKVVCFSNDQLDESQKKALRTFFEGRNIFILKFD